MVLVIVSMTGQQSAKIETRVIILSCSTRLNRGAEDVRVQAMIIAELKLVDVEMQILLADFVERADDPAFHDGPKAFDGIGMNSTTDIFPFGMMDHTVRERRIEATYPL